MDELRQIADELKGQDKIPFSFGDQEQWPAGHMFSIGASNVLGREGLDDIFYGDGRWDTPEVVTAIELIFRDFVENGYYPEGVNAITYDDANALFYSGEAAMNPTGTWLVSTISRVGPGLRGRFLPVPVHRRLQHLAARRGWSGPVRAQEREEPRRGDQVHRLHVAGRHRAPGHGEVQHHPRPPGRHRGLDVPELFKQVLEDLAATRDSRQAFGYNIDVLAPQNFNEVMFTGFQEVFNGSRSAEEQATALQEAWEEAKQQGNIPTQE